MANKIDKIPENMTLDEASDFWDTHSVADYPSHEVKIDFSLKENVTLVAIDNNLVSQLEKQAKESGKSIESLINLWIKEKLAA